VGRSRPAWQGKELPRAVYAADDLADARAALKRFYHWCDGVQILELSRLAGTVRAWEAEILGLACQRRLRQRTHRGVNLLSKNIKRVGHGFRNLTNYRLRLLLHCGVTWQTHQTARLRGRSHSWRRRAGNDNAPSAARIRCRGRAGEAVAAATSVGVGWSSADGAGRGRRGGRLGYKPGWGLDPHRLLPVEPT
jgi:hypothetical protein